MLLHQKIETYVGIQYSVYSSVLFIITTFMSPFQKRELEEGEIYEPDVWEMHTDPIGMRPFYYSHKYRFSVYDDPIEYSGVDAVILDHGPQTWVKHFAYYLDEDGEERRDVTTFPYYHCPETDEISYEIPFGYVEVIREYEEERSGRIVTSLIYPRLPPLFQ
jgi:hypothetical protein